MERDKYPERVPFRLTRMLINAMEVCGIEGNFRSTCERVMQVLRENKDSVMAMLEAFVHDPLINWRLLQQPPNKQTSQRTEKRNTVDTSTADFLDADARTPTQANPVVGTYTSASVRRTSIRRSGNERIRESDADETDAPAGKLNEKALRVINRILNKLTGKDFGNEQPYDVPDQVDKLILQATSHDNLCQSYLGWCPYW
eukprot:GFYU01027299.1.p1 GENE.GFYU01027299.1~~GFYU01027299.1.p1  ORF type:complete len:233 (-),score=56.68 GFYU01027299.1:70-669(-)